MFHTWIRQKPILSAISFLILGMTSGAGAQDGLSGEGSLIFWEGGSGDFQAHDSELFGSVLASGDFNGDGNDDLAVGIPGDHGWVDPSSLAKAGSVQVRYGARGSGLGPPTYVYQPIPFAGPDYMEAGDQFGSALAVCDIDQDGFDDLAVGVPFEDVGSDANTGAIHIFYGSASGLTFDRDEWIHRNTANVAGQNSGTFRFGNSLACGRFDLDNYFDLAVGSRGNSDAGDVTILYGNAAGISGVGSQRFDQGSPGIASDPFTGEDFALSLAAGDLNADGADDLAVGVQRDALAGSQPGSVHVLPGGVGGLSGEGSLYLHQDSPGISDIAENLDFFGHHVLIDRFGSDAYADLAIGVPWEPEGGITAAGAFHLLFGSEDLLTVAGESHWTQTTPGVPDLCEQLDRFGSTLAAGDFDADLFLDLAIGIPGENDSRGAVVVLRGDAGGLSSSGAKYFDQDSPGLELAANEIDDQFGYSLTAGDFNGDGADDLAIGAPTENVPSGIDDNGAVFVLYGRGKLLFGDGFESGDTSQWGP